jgi:glycosyltransferase involved in cell wall biosynthesis
MAAGKPILGAINGETQALIKEAQCGICVPAEDASALAAAAREFCETDKRDEYAKNSYAYSAANFDKEAVCERLLSHLA